MNILFTFIFTRSARAKYVVVTEFMGEDNSGMGYESYVIEDTLHEMIRSCPSPHNNSFDLVVE